MGFVDKIFGSKSEKEIRRIIKYVDAIEASYTDGMLNVLLPKKAAEIPASRRLEIK